MNLRRRWGIQSEFAETIVNRKWIRENDSELEVNSLKKSEFAKEIGNSKWIRENDRIELKKIESEFAN